MAERVATRNVLWPAEYHDVDSPKAALALAARMVARLEASRSIGILSHHDAGLMMDAMPFRQRHLGDSEPVKLDHLKLLRFGDLMIPEPEQRTEGCNITHGGHSIRKPRNSLQIRCGCGCEASVSTTTLQRRNTINLESIYHPPVGEFPQFRAEGVLDTTYYCSHISLLLEKWFPQMLATWRDVRQRIYNMDIRGRIRKGQMGDLSWEPEWFRKDVGLFNFINDVGPPKAQTDDPDGGWALMATSKLTKFRQRGKYQGPDFYWRGAGEPEHDLDIGRGPKGPTGLAAGTVQRVIYTRFYAARKRAKDMNLRFEWAHWPDFWTAITSTTCPDNARLPADFVPGAYQLRFEQGGRVNDPESGKEGMCIHTLYWTPTTKHVASQGFNPAEAHVGAHGAPHGGALTTQAAQFAQIGNAVVRSLEAIDAQDGQPGLFSLFKVVGDALNIKPALSTVPEKENKGPDVVPASPPPLQAPAVAPTEGQTTAQKLLDSLRDKWILSQGVEKDLEAKEEEARRHYDAACTEDKEEAMEAWDKVAEERQERIDLTNELHKKVEAADAKVIRDALHSAEMLTT